MKVVWTIYTTLGYKPLKILPLKGNFQVVLLIKESSAYNYNTSRGISKERRAKQIYTYAAIPVTKGNNGVTATAKFKKKSYVLYVLLEESPIKHNRHIQ